nr:hypothetical protein [Psychrobacter sp. PraFG1]UNK05243.1 hypothetical protein MN210_15080 [Psychrobacter sp. PraFG1]
MWFISSTPLAADAPIKAMSPIKLLSYTMLGLFSLSGCSSSDGSNAQLDQGIEAVTEFLNRHLQTVAVTLSWK